MQFHDEKWKNELAEHRKVLAAFDPSVSEQSFEAERSVLYSAFIIRKLIEDTAITDRLRSRSVEVQTYPATSSPEARMLRATQGPLAVEDHFDLTTKRKIRLGLEDFASEIIHSDPLVWDANVAAPGAILVSSYRNAQTRLLRIPIDLYVNVIDRILSDNPTKWWTSKDLTSGKITRHAE